MFFDEMNLLKRVSLVFEAVEQIPFDDHSRFILMSDCHRGDGSWADDFSKNQNIYFAALTYYYRERFTYIEIGDGDELWENKDYSEIIQAHGDVFALLMKFINKGRLHFIYGNHDLEKTYKIYEDLPILKPVKVHEGLILRHKMTNHKIFLIHGHQVDFRNSNLWRLNRLLVRYIWRPLESFGINDPTSTAKNYEIKEAVEIKLTEWVVKNGQMLIAGHTHRPMFPNPGEPPYFNDGSCVHPRGITGIEIEDGKIVLVKWSLKVRNDGTLYVAREVLAGPRTLNEYFTKQVNGPNQYLRSMNKSSIVEI